MVTVASLQARADGGQFSLALAPNTSMKSGPAFVSVFGSPRYIQLPHPEQSAAPRLTNNLTAISWTAVYRSMRLAGNMLVVDSALASATPASFTTPAVVLTEAGLSITGIWGSSPTDVRAIAAAGNGSNSQVFHWNGTSWTLSLSLPGYNLGANPGCIWGTSNANGSPSTNVWVVGYKNDLSQGVAYQWNGKTWTLVESSSSILFTGVSGTSPLDVWLSGINSSNTQGFVLHFNGTAWSTSLTGSFYPFAISASAPNCVMMVGSDLAFANGIWASWNGTSWSAVNPLPSIPLYNVTSFSPTLAYAVCEFTGSNSLYGIYQWNGLAWVQVGAQGIAMDQVFGSPSTGLWAIGGTGASQGVVYNLVGGSWRQVANLTSGTMFSGWFDGLGNVWIGGENNTQTSGLVWRAQSLPAVVSSWVQKVLDHANATFDLIDLRQNLFGYPQNARQGPVGFPQNSSNAPPGTGGPIA